MMTQEPLKSYTLYRASKKNGKVDTQLEATGCAMLKLWALNNTTRTKETYICETVSRNIIARYTGTETFPKVESVAALNAAGLFKLRPYQREAAK